MSDLQLVITETVENVCKELCKYSDDYLISSGGMNCKQYCLKHECPLDKLLKECDLK